MRYLTVVIFWLYFTMIVTFLAKCYFEGTINSLYFFATSLTWFVITSIMSISDLRRRD